MALLAAADAMDWISPPASAEFLKAPIKSSPKVIVWPPVPRPVSTGKVRGEENQLVSNLVASYRRAQLDTELLRIGA